MTRKRVIKLLMSGGVRKQNAKRCLIFLDIGVFSNHFDVLSFYLQDIKHSSFKEYNTVKQNEKNAQNIFNRWFEE